MPALRRTDWLLAGALVLFAALFRLPRLTQTPGWDGDEGYNVEIAWQLWHGRAQAFAMSYAFVQHPVLSYAVLGPLLGAFGRELWVLRALTAVAGSLTAGLICLGATLGSTRRTAVLAGVAFAGAPFVVAHNRLGYTYNLLLFWSALALFFVVAYRQAGVRHWLWAAAATAALGLLTDQEGIYLPVFVALGAWPRHREATVALLIGVVPALIAAAVALAWHPEAALVDWRQSLLRAGGVGAPGVAALVALARWVVNYLHLLRAEWWWPAAVAGLFTLRPPAGRRLLLLLAGLMVVPIFALRELHPFFRTGVPLLLPAAWGLGALLDRGIDAAYETLAPSERRRTKDEGRIGGASLVASFRPSSFVLRLVPALVAAFVVVLPLGLEIGRTAGSLATGFSLPIDWALLHEHEQARAAAAYVNANTTTGDIVLVSPAASWLYGARTADFLQTIAYRGEGIAFYPAGLSPERFRYPPTLRAARYVVLDPFWDLWASDVAPVAQLVAEIETWPQAWRSGPYRVYRNPA
ncbi:MAG: glycosyltransferase family 39 protein [Chloroflexi bacterium]|nr:glycosyltransferase family 39 protein [Chloroflexota bacterium]